VFVEPYSPQYTEFRVGPCEYADQAPLIPSLCRSKDAVIHLWDLPQTAIVKTKSLKPYQAIDCSSAKHDADLTSLDWNCHGTLLSVGSYDATLRIYTVSAELYFESRLHKVRTPGWRVYRTLICRPLSGPNICYALLQGREMARYCQLG
jgi:WD40 repeat protein